MKTLGETINGKMISTTEEVTHFKLQSNVILCLWSSQSKCLSYLILNALSPAAQGSRLQESLDKLLQSTKVDADKLDLKILSDMKDWNPDPASLARHKWKSQKVATVPLGSEAYFYAKEGRLRVEKAEKDSVVKLPSNRAASGPKKVLIIDDSKTIRTILKQIFSEDKELVVVGECDHPSKAEKMIEELKPDVLTLDIHMPDMDGVTLLRKIFPKYRLPTVMISSLSMEDGGMVLAALESGAVDYVQKPSFDQLDAVSKIMIEKVKTAASSRIATAISKPVPFAKKLEFPRDALLASRAIAVGASTGGTEAIRAMLHGLPDQIPPILIVQHIPPIFSTAFAKRLNEIFPFEVKEAEDRDAILCNRVLIAPGGKQMIVEKLAGGSVVRILDTEPVNRHKPSVDVLFNSVALTFGRRAVGILLTGMGVDGAAGLLSMKEKGSYTIAQDEATSIVFGMPRAAIQMGAAIDVRGLFDIAPTLIAKMLPKKSAA